MNNLFRTSILALAVSGTNFCLTSAAFGQAVDSMGFSDAGQAAAGTNTTGYDVTGQTVDSNGPTTFQSQYNNALGQGQTGSDGGGGAAGVQGQTGQIAGNTTAPTTDAELTSSPTAKQNAASLITMTGLLAPNSVSGRSFQGAHNLGFHGSTASMPYHGAYDTQPLGAPMPAVGTGEPDVNITVNGYE